ncbi:hypothetical protein CR513_18727, partial [Mucuna pruriens]
MQSTIYPHRRFRIRKGEESASCGYEAIKSYHSWMSLNHPAKGIPLPFPNQIALARRSKIDEDLLKLFKKVEINIPLLHAIKQVTKYPKFLKELCVHKRKKMKGAVKIGGVVSTLVKHENTSVQWILQKKVSRPRHLCSSMHHRQLYVHQCNTGPQSINKRHVSANIQVTQLRVLRADRDGDSTCQQECCATPRHSRRRPHPSQQVDFPSKFLCADMEDEASGEGSAMILGRPFLMTAKTKIDVHARILSMEFRNTFVKVSQPTLSIKEQIISPQSNTKLKPLPKHLKYAFLGDHQQFPVIINNNLNGEQEEKLLEVLNKHKKAICWTLTDLPGINPSIAMHKILLEKDAHPIRKQQRRLSPTILDVVKKEVTKLLAVKIIYPISDSQWVCPIQVVPKKLGMIVIKNRQDKMHRTLKELAMPDVVYQPLCIKYPQLEPTQSYELKSGLIHLLPKFHGLVGEDPHKHLKKFHVVCSTMRPQGIPKDYIKMKVFSFSLDGATKDWLYLQPALFNT